MSDLRGSEGLWCLVAVDHDYLNARIVEVDEDSGEVEVRLADGSLGTFHWSRIRL